MKKKVAVLLDAGFVKIRLQKILGRRPEVEDIYSFALECATNDEEIFRIYYYDCPPYQQPIHHRKDKSNILFTPDLKIIEREVNIQRKISLKDLVAYRSGELSYSGWKLKHSVAIKITE